MKGLLKVKVKKSKITSFAFTLIELLALIAVLIVILMISLPNVFNIVEKNKQKRYDLLVDSIENGARLYVNERKEEVEGQLLAGSFYLVTVGQLNYKGLIKENLVNPLTNEIIPDTKKIFIFPDKNNILVYCFEDRECAIGLEAIPIITLLGDNPMLLNLGIPYDEPGAIAKDSMGNDLEVEIIGEVNYSSLGIYYINYQVVDGEGHQAFAQREVQVIDQVIPVANFSPNGNLNYSKKHNSIVTVTEGSIAIQSLKYLWSESSITPNVNEFVSSFNNGGNLSSSTGLTGEYYLWILITDTLSNTYFIKSNVFNLDNLPPTCVSSGGSSSWTKNNVTITGKCSDSQSGCKGDVSKTYSTTTNGSYSPGTVEDNAGNTTTCPTQTVKVDKTAPTCVSSGGSSSWTKNNVTITGKCTDSDSGCKGDVSQIYSSNTNGSYSPGTVEDNVGNKTTCPNQTVRVDKTAPTFSNVSSLTAQQFNGSTYYSPSLTSISCGSTSCSAKMTICKKDGVMNVLSDISASDNVSVSSFYRDWVMYDKNGNPTPDGGCYWQIRPDVPCLWKIIYKATDHVGNVANFTYNITINYATDYSSPVCVVK